MIKKPFYICFFLLNLSLFSLPCLAQPAGTSEETSSLLKEIGEKEKEKKTGSLGYLYQQLGDLYAKEGKDREAIEAYKKALAQPYPVLPTVERLKIVNYLINTDQYDPSLEELNKILSREPQNTDALVLKGRALLWQGKTNEAEESAKTVLKQDPQNSDALLIEADILVEKNQYKEALPIYQNLLTKKLSQKSEFQARYGLARAQIGLKQYDQAANTIQGLNPKQAYQEKQKTKAEKALADAKAGIVAQQEVNKERPQEAPKTAPKETVCASHLEKIGKANQDPKERAKLSLYYKELGDCYRNNQNHAGAVESFEKAFTLPYGSLTITDRIDMAEFLGHQDHYKTAIDQLKRVLEVEPKNIRAQILVARFLSWDEKYAEAEQYIDQALAQDPKRKEAILVKADILNWTEKSEQAIPLYQQLLDRKLTLNPEEHFAVNYGMALALTNLGRYGEAAKYMAELKPQFPYQKKLVDKLVTRLNNAGKEKTEEQKKQEEVAKAEEKKEERPGPERKRPFGPDDFGDRIRVANDYANCFDYDTAYGILYALLLFDPCDSDIHVALGRVLGLDGWYCDAIRELKCAISLNPTNVGAWVILGYVLRWKGDIPGSTWAFNQALWLNPCDFGAKIGLAWTDVARNYRPEAKCLYYTADAESIYDNRDKCQLARYVVTGPITDFQFSRYKDSDDIRVYDYLLQETMYRGCYRYNAYYDHVFASQPIGFSNQTLKEWSDKVGINVLRMFNPCFDFGVGLGYAHTREGNFPTGGVLANWRTHCGIFNVGSAYDIFTGTAAAFFFKIRTWTTFVEYFNKFTGRWAGGFRYYYTKWSDANHSHKAQLAVTYTLLRTYYWNLYVEYQLTYWDFESQPVSPFVVPGVFGGHGYFDPQKYCGNQLGLLYYYDNNRYILSLRPYGAYVTYFVQGIHYYGFLYAAVANFEYYFTPCFHAGGTVEAGRYPLKHLKYNYTTLTARVSWAF